MRTREALIALAVAVAALTAGCGFILGQEAATFSASPATVADGALSDTGYEEVSVTDQTVLRNFSTAGQTRQVEVTNQLSKYERQIDLGPLGSLRAAVFVAFTSPQVTVAGETFNPIADMSERDVLAQFESQYEGISVGSRVGSRTATALGAERTVKKFEGTATLGGAEVDVYVHATKFKHEGDHLVAIGIYPQRLDGEENNVLTLVKGLEHSGGN